ncbi:hypothetical protein SLEP1_g48298 [Rubroshorea leprosula]|uniref:Uncharacterized protein n=1 Tax=Rubroshorea leprosula TaxID=152421 RepID=A0AAV5LV51_9ROSI|nr:hypothetical protein SLEP1_g48298 [Rubroshorea leprosula]
MTKSLLANAVVGELSNDVEGLGYHVRGLQAHNTRKCNTGKEIGVKDRVQFKRKKLRVQIHFRLRRKEAMKT